MLKISGLEKYLCHKLKNWVLSYSTTFHAVIPILKEKRKIQNNVTVVFYFHWTLGDLRVILMKVIWTHDEDTKHVWRLPTHYILDRCSSTSTATWQETQAAQHQAAAASSKSDPWQFKNLEKCCDQWPALPRCCTVSWPRSSGCRWRRRARNSWGEHREFHSGPGPRRSGKSGRGSSTIQRGLGSLD